MQWRESILAGLILSGLSFGVWADTPCNKSAMYPAKISWDLTADRLFVRKGGLLYHQTASVEFATGANPDASGILELIETDGHFTTTIAACGAEFNVVEPNCSAKDGPIRITTGAPKAGFCQLKPNTRYFYNIRLDSKEPVYFTFKFMHTQ